MKDTYPMSSDRIPSREECDGLMVQHSMRPNIVEHSIQVMHVSLAIADNLKNGVAVNRAWLLQPHSCTTLPRRDLLKQRSDTIYRAESFYEKLDLQA